MTPPRIRAERCFALARSTAFEGERESAIKKGLAICERDGLDPDTFDIPGRPRTKAPPPPPSSFREDIFTRPRSPFWAGNIRPDDIEHVMRAFRETVAAQAAERDFAAAAQEEARRKAYRDGVRENERQTRDRQAERADEAANKLFAMGIKVYRAPDAADGSRRWHVVGSDTALEEIGDDELVALAVRHHAEESVKASEDRAAGVLSPEFLERHRADILRRHEDAIISALYGQAKGQP